MVAKSNLRSSSMSFRPSIVVIQVMECGVIRTARISREVSKQSMAGFSPILMELYQKSEALIQPMLFNLERKKRGLKARVLRSQPKLRIAFMVLLRQFRRPQCSCSV